MLFRSVVAHGESKGVSRYKYEGYGYWSLDGTMGPRCIAGSAHNLASFVINRFYRQTAMVDELSLLAAYSIWCAHKIDSIMVDGLNLAIFRDSTRRFEWADASALLDKAKEVDTAMRSTFRTLGKAGERPGQPDPVHMGNAGTS